MGMGEQGEAGVLQDLHLSTIEFVGALIKRPRADNIRPYGIRCRMPEYFAVS